MVALEARRHMPPVDTTSLELRAHDGLGLAVETRGNAQAPALVFAHGFGQTRHAWSASATALADEGWYCLTADARGHGDSGWRDGPRSSSLF